MESVRAKLGHRSVVVSDLLPSKATVIIKRNPAGKVVSRVSSPPPSRTVAAAVSNNNNNNNNNRTKLKANGRGDANSNTNHNHQTVPKSRIKSTAATESGSSVGLLAPLRGRRSRTQPPPKPAKENDNLNSKLEQQSVGRTTTTTAVEGPSEEDERRPQSQRRLSFTSYKRCPVMPHSYSLGNLRTSQSTHQLTFSEQLVPTFRVPDMTVEDAADAAEAAAQLARQQPQGATKAHKLSRSYKSMNDLQSQQLSRARAREITSIN